MVVRGDVSRDSRVLREARSAAAAGHTVSIVDQPAGATSALALPDLPAEVSVVHVARPERTFLALTPLGRPWRRASRGLEVARGRGRAIRRAAELGAAVALLPWIAVRGVWNGLIHLPGRFRAVDLNHVLLTPDTLSESLAAGVPVVSSDTPARRRVGIDDPDGPLGAVCDATPTAIATAIRGVLSASSAARTKLWMRRRTAAAERWNWNHESARLLAAYDGALAKATQ